jgi:hypothetical protein
LEFHAWLWPQLGRLEQHSLQLELAAALRELARPLPVTPRALLRVGLPNAKQLARGHAALAALLDQLMNAA